MATTDARTGFRLPWSSEPRPETDESGADTGNAGSGEMTDESPGPTTEASTGLGGDPSTRGSAQPGPQDAVAGTGALEPPRPVTPRRPSKFLADLTKAMQTAAEAAREEALGRLQNDAKTAIEEIHGRSSTEAEDLRRRADEDVSSIREWSKQEIARIREETEHKVSDRKGQLEREIEDHAALIERQIDHIQGQVGAFEAEMAAFFERLIGEDDPTRFAELAESLPEPPPLEDLAAWAATATVPTRTFSRPAPDDRPADAVDDTPAVEAAVEVASAAEAVAEAAVEPGFGTAGPSTSDANAEPVQEPDSRSGFVGEADVPSLQASAPAATPEWDYASDRAPVGQVGESHGDASPGTDAIAETPSESPADDPRLVITVDQSANFAAAEAEAAASIGADEDVEDIPVIGDEALAARLAGLVASDTTPGDTGAAASSVTNVVVNGLVSVASIASFKRQLGRLAGVQSVGVSSGPEGEFVFAVTHGPDIVLVDAIPALPGFQARVTANTDQTIDVTAHDPDAEG